MRIVLFSHSVSLWLLIRKSLGSMLLHQHAPDSAFIGEAGHVKRALSLKLVFTYHTVPPDTKAITPVLWGISVAFITTYCTLTGSQSLVLEVNDTNLDLLGL